MKYLLRYEDIHAVKHTRHNERETLYWTKCASLLGHKQKKLIGSEVPIPAKEAGDQLHSLVRKNLSGKIDYTYYNGIYLGWAGLCLRYAPVFIEKSPHYLANWSNLELIIGAIEMLPKIAHQIIGLVRHPLNTLCSIHRRWKLNLYEYEKQWRRSYNNLLRLKDILPDKVHIIKYEDMCKTANHLKPVIEFAGYKEIKEASFKEPRKIPESFNFKLQESTIKLAEEFGYERIQ